MEQNKYRVDLNYSYEGSTGSRSGYEIVFAGSLESAKLTAKAKALASFKKQGFKVIFLDLKDPVKLE